MYKCEVQLLQKECLFGVITYYQFALNVEVNTSVAQVYILQSGNTRYLLGLATPTVEQIL